MGAEDAADGRRADLVSNIGESTLNTGVAPAAVFLGKFHRQLAYSFHALMALGVDAAFRGILQRDEFAMPCENRARRNQGGILLEERPTEHFSFLCEIASLAIVQLELFARLIELLFQNAVFFQQILDDSLLFAVHPAR